MMHACHDGRTVNDRGDMTGKLDWFMTVPDVSTKYCDRDSTVSNNRSQQTNSNVSTIYCLQEIG